MRGALRIVAGTALALAAPTGRAAGLWALDAAGDAAQAREVARVLRDAGADALGGYGAAAQPVKRPEPRLARQVAAIWEAYGKFDLEAAERAFAKALATVPDEGPWLAERQLLATLAVRGALIAHARGNAAVSAQRLRLALAWDRELTLTTAEYPPDFVAAFQDVRRRALVEPAAAVAVFAWPVGARVHVDGRFAGAAPLTLALDPGAEHYVRIEAPERAVWVRAVGANAFAIEALLPRGALPACPPEALARTVAGPLEDPCVLATAKAADAAVVVVGPEGALVAVAPDGRVWRDRFEGPAPTAAQARALAQRLASPPGPRTGTVIAVAAAAAAVVGGGVALLVALRPRETKVDLSFAPSP